MKKLLLALAAVSTLGTAAMADNLTIHNHTQVWIYGEIERHWSTSPYGNVIENISIVPGDSKTFDNVYKFRAKPGWINSPQRVGEYGRSDTTHNLHFWQQAPGYYVPTWGESN